MHDSRCRYALAAYVGIVNGKPVARVILDVREDLLVGVRRQARRVVGRRIRGQGRALAERVIAVGIEGDTDIALMLHVDVPLDVDDLSGRKHADAFGHAPVLGLAAGAIDERAVGDAALARLGHTQIDVRLARRGGAPRAA